MVSEKLKLVDKKITEMANKYRKSRSQSRFTVLFKAMINPDVPRGDKHKIWNYVVEVQYLKGAELTGSEVKK